jgi:hypothetical protein
VVFLSLPTIATGSHLRATVSSVQDSLFLAQTSPGVIAEPSASSQSTPNYSFRDDFNYASISQLQAAGWSTSSITPASYYSLGNSRLILLNDGSVGAAAGYSNIPANVSNWSVSSRVAWIGSSGTVSGSVGSLQIAVQTAGHSYNWMADGYYNRFAMGMDGHGVAVFPGYTKQLNFWHTLQLDMIHGTLYGYFDGSLIGSYTEPDTTPGNTNLIDIQVLASWETNNSFDWVQANNSPTVHSTFGLTLGALMIGLIALAAYIAVGITATIIVITREQEKQRRLDQRYKYNT